MDELVRSKMNRGRKVTQVEDLNDIFPKVLVSSDGSITRLDAAPSSLDGYIVESKESLPTEGIILIVHWEPDGTYLYKLTEDAEVELIFSNSSTGAFNDFSFRLANGIKEQETYGLEPFIGPWQEDLYDSFGIYRLNTFDHQRIPFVEVDDLLIHQNGSLAFNKATGAVAWMFEHDEERWFNPGWFFFTTVTYVNEDYCMVFEEDFADHFILKTKTGELVHYANQIAPGGDEYYTNVYPLEATNKFLLVADPTPFNSDTKIVYILTIEEDGTVNLDPHPHAATKFNDELVFSFDYNYPMTRYLLDVSNNAYYYVNDDVFIISKFALDTHEHLWSVQTTLPWPQVSRIKDKVYAFTPFQNSFGAGPPLVIDDATGVATPIETPEEVTVDLGTDIGIVNMKQFWLGGSNGNTNFTNYEFLWSRVTSDATDHIYFVIGETALITAYGYFDTVTNLPVIVSLRSSDERLPELSEAAQATLPVIGANGEAIVFYGKKGIVDQGFDEFHYGMYCSTFNTNEVTFEEKLSDFTLTGPSHRQTASEGNFYIAGNWHAAAVPYVFRLTTEDYNYASTPGQTLTLGEWYYYGKNDTDWNPGLFVNYADTTMVSTPEPMQGLVLIDSLRGAHFPEEGVSRFFGEIAGSTEDIHLSIVGSFDDDHYLSTATQSSSTNYLIHKNTGAVTKLTMTKPTLAGLPSSFTSSHALLRYIGRRPDNGNPLLIYSLARAVSGSNISYSAVIYERISGTWTQHPILPAVSLTGTVSNLRFKSFFVTHDDKMYCISFPSFETAGAVDNIRVWQFDFATTTWSDYDTQANISTVKTYGVDNISFKTGQTSDYVAHNGKLYLGNSITYDIPTKTLSELTLPDIPMLTKGRISSEDTAHVRIYNNCIIFNFGYGYPFVTPLVDGIAAPW